MEYCRYCTGVSYVFVEFPVIHSSYIKSVCVRVLQRSIVVMDAICLESEAGKYLFRAANVWYSVIASCGQLPRAIYMCVYNNNNCLKSNIQ